MQDTRPTPTTDQNESTRPAANIIPSGKYKGQPVEVLLADRQYLDWLTAQPWFRKHNLDQVIINYGNEPSETPDHNAMQVRFLDDEFCEKFVRVIQPDIDTLAHKSLKDVQQENLQYYADKLEKIEERQQSLARCYGDGRTIELQDVIGDAYGSVFVSDHWILKSVSNVAELVDRIR